MQINFIKANRKLCKNTYYQAVESMDQQLMKEGWLTPNQYNFIDGIYESVMKNAGLPAVDLHIDKKRKGLKYGA